MSGLISKKKLMALKKRFTPTTSIGHLNSGNSTLRRTYQEGIADTYDSISSSSFSNELPPGLPVGLHSGLPSGLPSGLGLYSPDDEAELDQADFNSCSMASDENVAAERGSDLVYPDLPGYVSLFNSMDDESKTGLASPDSPGGCELSYERLQFTRVPLLATVIAKSLESFSQVIKHSEQQLVLLDSQRETLFQQQAMLFTESIELSKSISTHSVLCTGEIDKVVQEFLQISTTCNTTLSSMAFPLSPQYEFLHRSSHICHQFVNLEPLLNATALALQDKLKILQEEQQFIQARIERLQKLRTELVQQNQAAAAAVTRFSAILGQLAKLKEICGTIAADHDASIVGIGDLPEEISCKMTQLLAVQLESSKLATHNWQVLLRPPRHDEREREYLAMLVSSNSGVTMADIIYRHTHPLITDTTAAKAFLSVYQYLVSPVELAHLFLIRFCSIPVDVGNSSDAALLKQTQIKVLGLIKLWIELVPHDLLEQDANGRTAIDLLRPFLSNPITNQFTAVCAKMLQRLDSIEKGTNVAIKAALTDAGPAPVPEFVNPNIAEMPELLNELSSSYVLAAISPREAARQLTLHIFDIYAALRNSEFFKLAWSKEKKETTSPNIQKLIYHFNGLSNFIISYLLDCVVVEQRLKMFEFFARTAIECAELHNYHTTLSIVSAFQNSAIFRLKATWAGLQPDTHAKLNELFLLLKDNSKLLRVKVENAPPFCIPYIGLYLTDLTFLEEGNPLYFDNQLINYQKIDMIGRRIVEFLQWQSTPYLFLPFPAIQTTFSDYASNLSPDMAHKRSLILEPHQKTPPVTKPERSMSFAKLNDII